MHILATRSTKPFSILAYFVALTFCQFLHAQGQTQTQPCPNTTASPGTTRNSSLSSVSQSAQNVANAAKSLGSIFKKKAPPANSSAAAPCSPANPSTASGPSANASIAGATPGQPDSGQPPTPVAAADSSTAATAESASQGASAPWQPPSDTSGATVAPAGPLDPAKLPDVVGIHLGMPREDVAGILLKLHPGNPIQPEGPNTVAGLFFSSDLPGKSGGDNIHVEFTLPPGKQRVYYIERGLQYKLPLSRDNVLASLRQKYGHEIFYDPNGAHMFWLFDEQGHPIPPDKNAQQRSPYGCDTAATAGNMYFRSQVNAYLHDGLPPATFCDSVIVLHIMVPPDPVVLIGTSLEDRALFRREVIAAGEAAKAEGQKQRQQELKNANQAKPNL
jgi:hypothetical protein